MLCLLAAVCCPHARGMISAPRCTQCLRGVVWCAVMCRACPRRWFGIPSYYVQQMFRQAQGTHYLATTVFTNPATEVGWALLGGGLACQRAAAVRFTV